MVASSRRLGFLRDLGDRLANPQLTNSTVSRLCNSDLGFETSLAGLPLFVADVEALNQ
jgi:hypothetical protein